MLHVNELSCRRELLYIYDIYMIFNCTLIICVYVYILIVLSIYQLSIVFNDIFLKMHLVHKHQISLVVLRDSLFEMESPSGRTVNFASDRLRRHLPGTMPRAERAPVPPVQVCQMGGDVKSSGTHPVTLLSS